MRELNKLNSVLDYYEGENTFKCEVQVLDFLEFLTSNYTLVSNFITSKLEEYNEIKSL